LADYHFKGSGGDFLDKLVRIVTPPPNAGTIAWSGPVVFALYDMSYLLNRALWDRYFVSTIPHAGTGTVTDTETTAIPSTLPNSRHVRQAGVSDNDLRDADKAAAGLLLSGGFNINSTSEQAWRAVLGGINKLPYDPVTASPGGTALQSALPRFSKPTATADVNSAQWQGYRQLTEPQIAQLARNIVAEVRNRGPFVSMGDFVNRRLRDNTATTSATLNADERFKGAIQNAIDAAGTLNAGVINGSTAVNTGTSAAFTPDKPFTIKNSSGTVITPSEGPNASVELMQGGPQPVAPYGSRAAFAPQFLTQADVLSAIGAGLSARSDTFVIRVCGETVNPLLASADAGYVTGRAWCEAIVQRVVEPLRRKNANPASSDYNEPAVATPGQPDFGRRFQIVSFRWLTQNDI
jgi:hypothetical protein